MKFSYYLPCYYTDKSKPAAELYSEAEYQAQYAEDLGYDAIVIPEHYFMNYLACPNLLMFAVRVSQLVKLRIMSAVIPIPLYHPLRLAQDIAFADVLSGGRLEIGLGRGAFVHEFERLQIPRDRNRAMFNECLDIMIKAWTTQDDFSYEGDFWQFPETTVLPRPHPGTPPPDLDVRPVRPLSAVRYLPRLQADEHPSAERVRGLGRHLRSLFRRP